MESHKRAVGRNEALSSRPLRISAATRPRTSPPRHVPYARLEIRSLARVLARAAAGAIGLPIAILLHELGHLLAFMAFGFQDVILGHASVGWNGKQEFWHLIETGNTAAAAAFAEPWNVAVAIAAGPAMTYLTVITCTLLAWRVRPFALVLAIGIAAPLRSLAILPVLSHNLLGDDPMTGFDEIRVAVLTNTPQTPYLFFAVAVLVGGWWLLVRAVYPGCRWQQLGPIFAGMMTGGWVWFLWFGPWLLPS